MKYVVVREGHYRYLRTTDPRDLEAYAHSRKDAKEFDTRWQANRALKCQNAWSSSWPVKVVSDDEDAAELLPGALERAAEAIESHVGRLGPMDEGDGLRLREVLLEELREASHRAQLRLKVARRLLRR